MARRRVAAGLLALALSASCSSYTPPSTPPTVVPAFELDEPPMRVWGGVLDYLNENDIPIDLRDDEKLRLRTQPISIADDKGGFSLTGTERAVRTEWCDCGTQKLADVYGSETRISQVAEVALLPAADGRTRVQVQAFFGGVAVGKKHIQSDRYDLVLNLTCVTTGKREAEIIDYVRKAATKKRVVASPQR